LMVGTVLAARSRAFVISALILLGLTALILVSAAVRLSLYLQAYGWTELRFYVLTSIAWLAVAGVLATVLLVRDRMRWLVHGLAIAAVAVSLGVSSLGPQAFVTSQNVARVLDPSLVPPDGYPGLDLEYLLTLDDDAIPALVSSLDALAPSVREKVLAALAARRDELAAEVARAGPVSWNLAREQARELLATLPDR
jgi:two-component system sensor histidine kinase BaeS